MLHLDDTQHLQESADIFLVTSANSVLERSQMLVNLRRELSPFRRRVDGEGAPVFDARRVINPRCQPIENAGERRSFVRQPGVEFRDRRGRGRRQMGEDVRLSLRQPVLAKISEVQADAMRRTVDGRNEA